MSMSDMSQTNVSICFSLLSCMIENCKFQKYDCDD